MSDGSRILTTSISPLRTQLKLSVDSLNNPAFNPSTRLKRTLQASDQLEKFKSRFQKFL